jgi:DUF4097 and DUF4098 domain-containing protein YvlB
VRRASIILPLILIALGVLFLANNFWPTLSVVDLVVRSWPYVLIVWGLLRLVEIFVWHVQGKPLPLRGLGGGEWAVIVLVTLMASGTYEARRHFPGFRFGVHGVDMFGETFDYPVDGKSPANAKFSRILIENMRGNCRIVGSDAAGVAVTGRKTVRAFKQDQADQSNKQSPLEISVAGDQLVVRSNHDRVSGDRRVSSDLELTVPKNVSLELRGRYGDFEVNDIAGNVDVLSDNAGVRLQSIGGGVHVDLRRSDIVRAVDVKGAVELKGRGQDVELENIQGLVTISGSYSGELQLRNLAKAMRFDGENSTIHVEKIPGSLRLALGNVTGSDLVGPIVLTARNRDVELSDFTQGLDITLDRGDVELRPGRVPLGKMDVRTRKGNIELALPKAAKFELKATTARGEIENEYGDPLHVTSSGENNQAVAAVVGSGGATVTLNTDRGGITIRKGEGPTVSEAPKPPAPPTRLAKPPRAPAEPLSKADNQ